MNIKALLTTLAITSTALFGGVAEAVQQDRIGYNQSGAYELYTSLKNTGVTVDITTCEDDDTYGWYMPSMNNNMGGIVICDNVATTYEEQWETLRHEAVHAAQHCRAWDTVMYDEWTNNNLTTAKRRLVTDNYEQSDWKIEWEAFALEDESNQFIAELVNTNCANDQV